MKSYSITRRLIITVLLVELLAALSISTAAMLYERHQRFRAFDIMLRGRADSLLGAVQDAEDKQDNVMLDGTEVNFPERGYLPSAGCQRPCPGALAELERAGSRLAGGEDREVPQSPCQRYPLPGNEN